MNIKARASYDLKHLKDLLQDPSTRVITWSARNGAWLCGYQTDEEIVREVCSLEPRDLVKSMPSEMLGKNESGKAIWQDVYIVERVHPRRPDIKQRLYIKLQQNPMTKAVVISFKPSES